MRRKKSFLLGSSALLLLCLAGVARSQTPPDSERTTTPEPAQPTPATPTPSTSRPEARSGDQAQAADETWIEELTEGTDLIRQQDAVDAECQRAFQVLVSDVKVSLARRVLRNAGELQHQVFKRGVAPLRQRLDVLAGPGRGRCASRRENGIPPLIKYLGLRRSLGRKPGRRGWWSC